MAIIHSKDGQTGVLIDRGTEKAIRFAIWYDTDSGDFEAFKVASDGQSYACDEDYKPLRYRGKAVGKLELVPLNKAHLVGVEAKKTVEPMRLTEQEKEQGVEDYRRLYYGVWGRREESKRSIDHRWIDFVCRSSFLDGLLLKKSRMIPTT